VLSRWTLVNGSGAPDLVASVRQRRQLCARLARALAFGDGRDHTALPYDSAFEEVFRFTRE
jgi:hypothetical protein